MIDIEKYRKRSSYNSSSPKAHNIDVAKRGFEDMLKYSNSAYVVDIGEVKLNVIINTTDTFPDVKYLLYKIEDEIKSGDVLKWKGDSWIVLEEDKGCIGYKKRKMQKCNHMLRWLDGGEIKEVPCFVRNYSLYTDGVQRHYQIETVDTKINITLPLNEDVNKFGRGLRFVIGRYVYELNLLDTYTTNGVYYATLTETEKSPHDNFELGIADYYNNINNYTIEILNEDCTLNTSKTLQLDVVVKNNGNVVDSPQVIYASSDESIATIDVDGNITCVSEGSVVVTSTFEDVSDSINLTITSLPFNNDFTIEIEGLDYVKLNRTSEYTCKLFNNGVDITQYANFVWEISDTTLASIDANNSICKVNGNSNYKLGYVTLKCIYESDTSVFIEKTIQVKNLF